MLGKNWYYPKENYKYSETGIASVYPEIIDSQYTKNGEKYANRNIDWAVYDGIKLGWMDGQAWYYMG